MATQRWIDVGGATVEADQVERVQDVYSVHGGAAEAGMKSVVTLRSGRWFYARYRRAAIIRRVRAASVADGATTEGE